MKQKCCRKKSNFEKCLTQISPSNFSTSLTLNNPPNTLGFINNKWTGKLLINFLDQPEKNKPDYVMFSEGNDEIYEAIDKLEWYTPKSINEIIKATLDIGIAKLTRFGKFTYSEFPIDQVYNTLEDDIQGLILVKYYYFNRVNGGYTHTIGKPNYGIFCINVDNDFYIEENTQGTPTRFKIDIVPKVYKETELKNIITDINIKIKDFGSYYKYEISAEIVKSNINPDESLNINLVFSKSIRDDPIGPEPIYCKLVNNRQKTLFGIKGGEFRVLNRDDMSVNWSAPLLFVTLMKFWQVSQYLIQHEFLHVLGMCHTHQINHLNPIPFSTFKPFAINSKVFVNTDAVTGNPLTFLNGNEVVTYFEGTIRGIDLLNNYQIDIPIENRTFNVPGYFIKPMDNELDLVSWIPNTPWNLGAEAFRNLTIDFVRYNNIQQFFVPNSKFRQTSIMNYEICPNDYFVGDYKRTIPLILTINKLFEDDILELQALYPPENKLIKESYKYNSRNNRYYFILIIPIFIILIIILFI